MQAMFDDLVIGPQTNIGLSKWCMRVMVCFTFDLSLVSDRTLAQQKATILWAQYCV